MGELFGYAGLSILVYVTLVWLLSLRIKDAGIMDVFWGIGFIIVSTLYFFLGEGYDPRKLLMLSIVLLWGTRLALHIGIRNHGRPEDARYLAWREQNGKAWWWKSFFKVFLLQGVVMWVLTLPFLAVHHSISPRSPQLFDWIGVGLFTFGFIYETVADWQLQQFKLRPENKGKLYTGGLWGLSRHPNYFGEAVLWWGFGFIAFSTGAWWVLLSPLLMTILLLRVSGVSMLDRLMKATKPGYEDYMRTTSAFIPLRKRTA